jgi:predicted CXXCH cytochrome family protein
MKRTIAMMVVMILAVSFSFSQSIRNTKHDLSSSSTATTKSTNVDQVCVFCHTPHSSATTTMLWNRNASAATYTVYSSPSMEGTVPQPGSASKNCLSCHDGTVAFNSLINTPSGVPAMNVANMSTLSGNLGSNLTNDHPIGFVYSTHQATDPDLNTAALTGGKVRVGTLPLVGTSTATATMECTSCHDPHDGTNGQFKRVSNTASAMCFTCHIK